MTKECKILLKKNNEREKEILEENDKIYTNMIVYLRSSDITEYNQELVREDLIEMIIDGQQRGENIEKIMGSRVKEICDEIIETFPKKSKKEKILGFFENIFNVIWIMGAIYIVNQIITALANGEEEYRFELTVGNLISMVFIGLIANVVVWYVCKYAFKEEKKRNKVVTFLKNWLIALIPCSIIVLSNVLLTKVVIEIPMLVAIVFVAVIYGVNKIISLRI